MTTPILYRVSVAVLSVQLESLRAIVKKGAEWCKTNNEDERDLIESRLTPDMLPFAFQIQFCCKSAQFLPLVAPVPQPTAIPASSDDPSNNLAWKYESFVELDSRIAATLEYLHSLDAQAFEGQEDKPVQVMHIKSDSAIQFVQDILLPNFHFHKTTAYNLLRKAGVELGKSDYLGIAKRP